MINKEEEDFLNKYALNLASISYGCSVALLSKGNTITDFDKRGVEKHFHIMYEYFYYLIYETHTVLLELFESKEAFNKIDMIWDFSIKVMHNEFNIPNDYSFNKEQLKKEMVIQYENRVDAFISSLDSGDDSVLSNYINIFGKCVVNAYGNEYDAVICYLASSLAKKAFIELDLKKLVEFYKE